MKKVLSVICLVLLLLELFCIEKLRMESPAITASRLGQQQTAAEPASPTPETAPAAVIEQPESSVPTPAPTPEVTPEPTPEPQKEFIISCLGDCTLWSSQMY